MEHGRAGPVALAVSEPRPLTIDTLAACVLADPVLRGGTRTPEVR